MVGSLTCREQSSRVWLHSNPPWGLLREAADCTGTHSAIPPVYSVRCQHWPLAGVAQRSECWPVNQKVTGWIPSQGTCLGCGPGLQLGACDTLTHGCFSPSLPPSLPLSLKINLKDLNKTKQNKQTKNNRCQPQNKEAHRGPPTWEPNSAAQTFVVVYLFKRIKMSSQV